MSNKCIKTLDGVFQPTEIKKLQQNINALRRGGMEAEEARFTAVYEVLGLETQRQLEVDGLVREATGMPQFAQPPRPVPVTETVSDALPPEGTPKPRTKKDKRGLPPALEAQVVKKTPGEMRAELSKFLGRGVIKQLEKLGVLILDKSRRIKTDTVGNKRAVQGAYDPNKGTIRLYGGTQHTGRSTVGVMLHEGSHSGMDRILNGQLAEFVNDIIKQAAAGSALAQVAITRAGAAQMDPAQVFANDRAGYVAREEIVAHYVQIGVEQGQSSGIMRRLMTRMKIQFSLSPFGKAARAVGVKVELTPETAVEYAREAVRDTIQTMEVLTQLQRTVKVKSGKGGSVNSTVKPAKDQLESATAIAEGMPGPTGEAISLRDTGVRFIDGNPAVSVNADTILLKNRIQQQKARTLEDILEDNLLFDNYPALRKYPVGYARMEGETASRINDTIYIDSRETDLGVVRDAVLKQVDIILADQGEWLGFDGEQTPSDYATLGKIYENADTPALQREIKRLMVDPVAASIVEGVLESSVSKATPGADLGRLAQLLGPKLYGDKRHITAVSTKELFQNSFDAVRAELMAGNIDRGFIDIKLDPAERSITIEDNGPGMSLDQINNAFLKIAGTDKKGDISSGGLGIAKMLFLFGNERLELVTVKNGKKHTLIGTGEQFMESFQDPELAPDIVTEDTEWTNRTIVKVVIPETFQDTATGEAKAIHFPADWQLYEAPNSILESPLFQDIEVSFNGKQQPVGADFPHDEFVPFTTVEFEWGTADIIIEKADNAQSGDNIIILSNGLQQFGMQLSENPFDMNSKLVPKKIFIDVHPTVRPEDEGYPFDLNRQRFSPAVDPSFKQIINYLSVLYGGSQAAETAEGFGEIEYANPDGHSSTPLRLAPEVKEDDLKKKLQVDKGSKMVVQDGKLTLDGKPLPILTAEDIDGVRVDLASFKIPQSDVDPTTPMIHNNMQVQTSPELEELAKVKRELKLADAAVTQLREEWQALMAEKTAIDDRLGNERFNDLEWIELDRRENEAYTTYTTQSEVATNLRTARNVAAEAVDNSEPSTEPLLDHLRDRFGEEKLNKYLGGLGTAFMEVRDAVAAADPDNYSELTTVPVGTSFDAEYYGVHVWVPFQGMFINPGTAAFVDPERAGMAMYMTMVHEIAHYRARGHDAGFVSELQRLTTLLEGGGMDSRRLKDRVSNFIEHNHDIFFYIHEEIENGSLTNIGKRFSEPSYDARLTSDIGDVAGVGTATAGGGSLVGATPTSTGDRRGQQQRGAGTQPDGGPRSLEELESAYNETSAAAGDIISPEFREAVGLPEQGPLSVEPPQLNLSEGNLLGQVMADSAYVQERIAQAVDPELESAATEYTEAYAEEQRLIQGILAQASEKAGHTVATLTSAQQLVGEDALTDYYTVSAEVERLLNLLRQETDIEAQQALNQLQTKQEAREAYFRHNLFEDFIDVQEVFDTLEEAAIPQDTYMTDWNRVILVEGIPIILESAPSDVGGGGITIAFRSLQDMLLRRDGYEKQMYFSNSTAAFRRISKELLLLASERANDVPGTLITFAPSNDARSRLYRRGLKKLGVTFVPHQTNILMELPEKQLLDNLSGIVTELESAVDTAEFQNWFGASQVIDRSGRPMPVVHATHEAFTQFRPEFVGRTGEPDTQEGEAYFFTTDGATGALVASAGRPDAGLPTFMNVYLKLENPIEWDSDQWAEGDQGINTEHLGKLIRTAKNQGRDGVIYRNQAMGDTYITFSPGQIKSVDNRGTFSPYDNDIFESSTPIDLDKVREEKRQAAELKKFTEELGERVERGAEQLRAEVAAADHQYEAGQIVILKSGRRARLLGKTMVADYRDPLPPVSDWNARRAVLKSRPKVAGYRMEYSSGPDDTHISDLPETSIREQFVEPEGLESAATLVDDTKRWLWRDRTQPDQANQLGALQKFLVNYYDDTWTMESKNEAVWDRYDLSKSRRSAMIDEVNRNFLDPMKGLVRETGLDLKEIDNWLAARHLILDNVNRNLSERSSLHYINKLVKHLDKPTRLELEQLKSDLLKRDDVSPKRIREQMYRLMEEYVDFERPSFDQRVGHQRQAVKEEWEDFKRHAGGMYDSRSGLENRGEAMDAAEVYNRYRDNAKVAAVAELYDRMTTEHLNILLEGGNITELEHENLLAENPHYVPLRRESFDYETEFGFLREQGSGPAKGVTVRGGSADVDAPIHIMQNTFSRMHLAAGAAQRNLANNFLYDEIMADRRNWTGWFTVGADNTRERHTELGFVVEGGTAALNKTDLIVLRGGKRLIIKPIEQNQRATLFAAAANKLGAQEVSGVFKIFGWVNSIVRFTAISASPSFLLANMIRDPLTALYNMQATEAAEYTKQIKGMYGKSFKALIEVYVRGNRDPNSEAVQMVERFEKAGGKISFTQSLKEMDKSFKSFEKEMWAEGTPGVKQIVHLFQQIENTNIAIENVMRLATFEVLHEPVGADKAARIAKDLTTNFDRRGFKSSSMGLLYLFFNATIQGNAQVIRNLSKSKKLQGMVGGTIVMAALFDIMGRALSDEDEYGNKEWDKITGKDRNIILPIPINGVYLRIPAPWVYNTVWRLGGMISETAAGTRTATDTASETMAMVLTTFNPMGGGTVAQALTPTALDPVMQVIENKDFAGNQLRPINFPGAGSRPDSELSWQSTPDEYKWLARTMNDLTGGDVAHSGWIDVAPSTIQNTVNFLGGGLARFAINTLNIPKDLATQELELKNVPIIRQLTTQPGTSLDTQKYYDKVAQVFGAEKAVKDYGRGATRDPVKLREAKKKFQKELRLVSHVKDVERQLKSLRQRMRAAQGRGDKRRVEKLKERIQSVQRRFLATFETRMGRN